jgi:hypothetical protein
MARKKPLELAASDRLVLFSLRMQELRQKKYYQLYDFEALRRTERRDQPLPALVDEEYLISYLALVRQFFFDSEPISRANVHRVLETLAKEQSDVHLLNHLERLTGEFHSVSIQLHWPDHMKQADCTDVELFNLFFHNSYFHTDADYFNFHLRQPKEAVLNARFALEVFTHRFVMLLQGYENLVNNVLSRGLLPQGKLGFEMVFLPELSTPERRCYQMKIIPPEAGL